jgi:hypothetical protein
MGNRENGAEIEIVREYDVVVLSGVSHDLFIESLGLTDDRPMHRVETVLNQEIDPARRKIQIDENLHGLASAISRSSASQAA